MGPPEGDLEIAGLGDEIQPVLPQSPDGDEWVISRAVIACQQEGVVRHQIQPLTVNADAAEEEGGAHGVDQKEPVERMVFCFDLFTVHKEKENPEEQSVEQQHGHKSGDGKKQKVANEGNTGITGKEADRQRDCHAEQEKNQ